MTTESSPHIRIPPRIDMVTEFKPISAFSPIPSPFALPPGYSIVYSDYEYPPSPFDWADNVIRYDSNSDTLRVSFKQTNSSSIKKVARITEGLDIFAGSNEEGQICYFEFQRANSTLVPHTFDTTAFINNQPPLQLSHSYDSISDFLCINFVSKEVSVGLDIVNLYDPSITFIFDVEQSTKRICGFQVMCASKLIAKNKV